MTLREPTKVLAGSGGTDKFLPRNNSKKIIEKQNISGMRDQREIDLYNAFHIQMITDHSFMRLIFISVIKRHVIELWR